MLVVTRTFERSHRPPSVLDRARVRRGTDDDVFGCRWSREHHEHSHCGLDSDGASRERSLQHAIRNDEPEANRVDHERRSEVGPTQRIDSRTRGSSGGIMTAGLWTRSGCAPGAVNRAATERS